MRAQTLRQAGANQGSRDPRACQMRIDVIPVLRGIIFETLEISTVRFPEFATHPMRSISTMGSWDYIIKGTTLTTGYFEDL